MSITLCEKCERMIDTDYRQTFEYEDYYELCEDCFFELEEGEDEDE